MNSEKINLVGKWVIILALVGTAIFCALTNRADIAVPFGIGAFWFWMLALN